MRWLWCRYRQTYSQSIAAERKYGTMDKRKKENDREKEKIERKQQRNPPFNI